MGKQPTNEKQSLIQKLVEPDPKIIQNWQNHEKKTIRSWCKTKISDFTEEEDFRELDIKLIRVQRFVGVSRLLADSEMDDLLEYLTDEFPDFATEEIDNAVRMAVSGKLIVTDIRGREIGAQHYNEFSALYLTPILKAYQNWRGSIIRKYYETEQAMIDEKNKKEAPPRTAEQDRQDMIKLALSNFESYTQYKNPILVGLHLVYDALQKEGIMQYDEARMEQFKEAAIANAQRGKRTDLSAAKDVGKIMQTSDIVSKSLQSDIKVLAVKAYFSELKELNAELSDYLKPTIVNK